ncbi:MAG: putative transcriptional regulator containing C-terminal CBS domain [Candidatus Methanohalarchaeum thermophilum]|uniref:Transcriptional regulator containing C-terminal CBS domain n=1 Tax=Methanohalarchaeum thermophilum TaxID=1903181 RepID=A0A1Q6DUS4_METT1|nr:MAG: putative transcriptional regulator containing C-terminal CBS domain [Candidatus Methanohalarchaeum thermophilum]
MNKDLLNGDKKMELTPAQKEILNTLINLFQEEGKAVKGEKVADSIGRNPGTIRNQMQSLKALELIEGVPGPKGGYKPTSDAYRALDLTSFEEGEPVQIYKKEEEVEGASAMEIDLTTLPQPDVCKASIRILGDIRNFEEGEKITIGPTPVNKMLLKGVVDGRDDIGNKLIIKISEIHSVPKIPVMEISSTELVTLSPDDTIQDATEVLLDENIRGAPVESDKEIKGMFTLTDLAKAVREGNFGSKVEDVMTPNAYSIKSDMNLIDAMSKMDEYDVSRLLIEEDEEYVGIITRTDILKRLCPY